MIYWGTPKYEEPIYSNPTVTDPQFTLECSFESEYPSHLDINFSGNLLGGRYWKFYDRQLAEREQNHRHSQFGLNKESPLIDEVIISEDTFDD